MMETLYKFSIDMNDIVVLFYLYSRRNKSKRRASCLFINTAVDRVPWQRSFCEILRESRLLLYHSFFAISRVAKSKRHASGDCRSSDVISSIRCN